MYFTFLDILDAVGTFMQRGGPVLWVIAWLLLIKWSLVFERIWYLNTTHKTNIKNTLADWNARTDTQSWSAHQIRTMMISKISLDVRYAENFWLLEERLKKVDTISKAQSYGSEEKHSKLRSLFGGKLDD